MITIRNGDKNYASSVLFCTSPNAICYRSNIFFFFFFHFKLYLLYKEKEMNISQIVIDET